MTKGSKGLLTIEPGGLRHKLNTAMIPTARINAYAITNPIKIQPRLRARLREFISETSAGT